jgi:hypothetical protein
LRFFTFGLIKTATFGWHVEFEFLSFSCLTLDLLSSTVGFASAAGSLTVSTQYSSF